MLTDEKRKKLLAGALAVVMLTGVSGCGNDKDSEWKNDNSAQNNQDEKKDEDNGGDFFHGFFPWYFIGRTFGYNVPIVMDSLVGSIESDMGIKAT